MTDYIVANGTAEALTDINAGGTDVAAQTAVFGVTLTAAELAAVLTNEGVAVMHEDADSEQRDLASTVLRVGALPQAASRTA